MAMSDVTEFLRARIDEDYAAADLVLRPYGDRAETNDAAWWADEKEWWRHHSVSSDETELLTRYTPQRVMAECEAKRSVIEFHEAVASKELKGDPVSSGMYAASGEAVLALAQAYAAHPDFPPHWLDE